jgi:hypothetical protein
MPLRFKIGRFVALFVAQIRLSDVCELFGNCSGKVTDEVELFSVSAGLL